MQPSKALFFNCFFVNTQWYITLAKIKREKDGVGDGETDDLDEAPIKQEDYWDNENDRSDLPENTDDYKEEPMVTDVDNRDGELWKYSIWLFMMKMNLF